MRTSFAMFLIGTCLAAGATVAHAGDVPADAFHVVDMDDVDHDVDAVLAGGRNVVLVFWQTWCGPCKREAPHLAEAAREHVDGLEFLGVVAGTDKDVDDTKVRRYVEKYDLPYAQIRDRDLSLTKQYEVVGTPTIIILGQDRKVLYRGNRPPEDWSAYDHHAPARG